MSRVSRILEQYYNSSYDEDFTSSGDKEISNTRRSRASRLGWKKYRNKYQTGIERNVRLNQLFVGRTSFLAQLRRRIKKVKNEIRRNKIKELRKKAYLDRYRFNLLDTSED